MEEVKNRAVREHPFFRSILKALWILYVPAAIASFCGAVVLVVTIFNSEITYEIAVICLGAVIFMIVFHFLIIKNIIKKLEVYDCNLLLKDMVDNPFSYPSYNNYGYLASLLSKRIELLSINRTNRIHNKSIYR